MSYTFVGYWEFGGEDGLYVSLERRPWWIHRALIRLAFGVRWVDGPTPIIEWQSVPVEGPDA